jgi:hypothetical protein
MLTPTVIRELAAFAARLADDVASDFATLSVSIGECADGSRRSYALISTSDGELEQEFRVTTPAPFNAPPWARRYQTWLTELRVGDDWHVLDAALEGRAR